MELIHRLTPCGKESDEGSPPTQSPITKMLTSSNGQWLAAVNFFGDVCVFNLETQRQHWFISRLDGASVTAAGFELRKPVKTLFGNFTMTFTSFAIKFNSNIFMCLV